MVRKKTTPQHADVLDAAKTGDRAFLAGNEDRLRAAVDAHGCTALHWAAGSGHIACVKYLVSQNLDPSQKQTTNGRTPLHYAARNGRTEVCRLLIEVKQAVFFKFVAIEAGWHKELGVGFA